MNKNQEKKQLLSNFFEGIQKRNSIRAQRQKTQICEKSWETSWIQIEIELSSFSKFFRSLGIPYKFEDIIANTFSKFWLFKCSITSNSKTKNTSLLANF